MLGFLPSVQEAWTMVLALSPLSLHHIPGILTMPAFLVFVPALPLFFLRRELAGKQTASKPAKLHMAQVRTQFCEAEQVPTLGPPLLTHRQP